MWIFLKLYQGVMSHVGCYVGQAVGLLGNIVIMIINSL